MEAAGSKWRHKSQIHGITKRKKGKNKLKTEQTGQITEREQTVVKNGTEKHLCRDWTQWSRTGKVCTVTGGRKQFLKKSGFKIQVLLELQRRS